MTGDVENPGYYMVGYSKELCMTDIILLSGGIVLEERVSGGGRALLSPDARNFKLGAVWIRAQDFDVPLTRLGVDIRKIQAIDVVGGRL